MTVNFPQKNVFHVCSVCKKHFHWNDDSFWFGTLDEVEFKVCSTECKEKCKVDKK